MGRRPQALDEPLEPRRLDRDVRRALVEVARELHPDLLEHLQVPVCDGVAGALERIERRVQLGRQSPDPRLPLEEAAAQQAAPWGFGSDAPSAPFPKPAREPLEVSSPRMVRPACRDAQVAYAPVRTIAASCREGCAKTRVAVSDLEIANDRIRNGGDPTHPHARWTSDPR